jgi:hypothetical protein
MDQNIALLSTGTGSTLLLIIVYLYKSMVGKKIRSKCCGTDLEAGFTVEEMSPHTFQVNPMTDTSAQSAPKSHQSSKSETTA